MSRVSSKARRTDGGTLSLDGGLLCTEKHLRRELWKIYDGPGNTEKDLEKKKTEIARFVARTDPKGNIVKEMLVCGKNGAVICLYKVRFQSCSSVQV